jgi:hypothetical protein
VSVEIIQLALIGLVLLGSVAVAVKNARFGVRSMYDAAFEWLYLWVGGGVALCLLEAVETMSRPLG